MIVGARAVAASGSDEFGRGISFLDGVYAFAATLLIANVDAPPPEAWHSFEALAESQVYTQLFGFALSFTVIAVFWRENVRIIRRLSGLDGPTIAMNLFAASLVILLSFTTQGISDPDSAMLQLPTVVYAVNIALVALAQTAMYELARSRGLERVPVPPRVHRAVLLDSLLTPAVFLLSIPVTLTLDANAGKLSWALLLVIGPISGALIKRTARRAGL